jgi:long-chain acyl-CoA synthetase
MTKEHVLHEIPEYETVRALIESVGNEYSDRTAYSYRINPRDKDVVKVSFAEMRRDVRSLASALLQRGCAGKHCALIGRFSYEWAITYFATLSIGAVLVPLDREWHAEDLADTVKKANAEYLFCDEDLAEKEAVIRQTAGIRTPTYFLGAPRRLHSLRALIAEGESIFFANPERYFSAPIDPTALALLVFTSGTTGKGKGVMLSTRCILDDMSNGIYLFHMPEKTIFALPAHHTFGSTVNLIGHYMQGLEIYINSGTRYILNELKQENPTHLVLVPLYIETFYKKIFASIEKQGKLKLIRRMMKLSNGLRKVGIDLREKLFGKVLVNFGTRMRLIVSGGAALNPDIIRDFDALGITILNGYGITECAPLISCNRNNYRKAGSVGRPIMGELVKIDSPNENGEGEICVKGTNVMQGYFENEEATAAAFDEEGYFHTGDLGRLDEEGWIYITGRLKNLIILSNGKNVYPEEIETELSRIYGVAEVVVYAGESRADSQKELIVGEIYPDKEALEMRGITDLDKYFHEEVAKVNGRMAPYKKVEYVKLRDEEFPKTTTRKITRFSIDKHVD